MMPPSTTLATMDRAGLSGRRGEARRNDAAILASARAVFIADPDAPVSAVARHAGVGISSLYRRYTSKEELLRILCGAGLQQYVDIARAAVEDENGDPWDVFATFMQRIVEADTHTLTINLAGRFTPTESEYRNAVLAGELNERLVARAKAAGVLRDDVNADDLAHVFEQVAGVQGETAERTVQLRARYLTLHLDALRAPGRTPLPGPAPTNEEHRARWQPKPTQRRLRKNARMSSSRRSGAS
jgi:AcrR family transcriptional regulator